MVKARIVAWVKQRNSNADRLILINEPQCLYLVYLIQLIYWSVYDTKLIVFRILSIHFYYLKRFF